MKRSWKKIKSRIVHENQWYRVREDDVIRPNGSKGKYFVIDDEGSVAVIAEDGDEKIYLVGQARYPINNIYSWGVITGEIKKGSSALESAKRELEEEAGITANKWKSLGYFYPDCGRSTDKCYVFLAKELSLKKQNTDDTEDIRVKKSSLTDLLHEIEINNIIDSHAISAIFKYLLFKDVIK